MSKTKEELEKEYSDKWTSVLMSTTPTNEERASEALKSLYLKKGFNTLEKIFIVDSPIEGAHLNFIATQPGATPDDVQKAIDTKSYKTSGSFSLDQSFSGTAEAEWIGLYEFKKDVEKAQMPDGFDELIVLCQELSWLFSLDRCAIMCRKPISIKIENDSFHSFEGPCFE